MLPTAPQVRSIVLAAQNRPNELAKDDLFILGGALLLELRQNDLGLSAQYLEISDGNDLQQDVVECLCNSPVDPTSFVIGPLVATFRKDQQFYEAMHALLALTFPETTEPVRLAKLGPMQIEVLNLLTTSDAIWQSDMSLQSRLQARGLPTVRHKMLRMLIIIA